MRTESCRRQRLRLSGALSARGFPALTYFGFGEDSGDHHPAIHRTMVEPIALQGATRTLTWDAVPVAGLGCARQPCGPLRWGGRALGLDSPQLRLTDTAIKASRRTFNGAGIWG